MKRYKVGSHESLELLYALKQYPLSDIFKSKAVLNLLEYNYNEVYGIAII